MPKPTNEPDLPTCDALRHDLQPCGEDAPYRDNRRDLHLCEAHFQRLVGDASPSRTGFRKLRVPVP